MAEQTYIQILDPVNYSRIHIYKRETTAHHDYLARLSARQLLECNYKFLSSNGEAGVLVHAHSYIKTTAISGCRHFGRRACAS